MIYSIVSGISGVIVGALASIGIRRRRPQYVIAEPAITPELDNLITEAAQKWAQREGGPFAEGVARPWMETFVKQAFREAGPTTGRT